MKKKFLLLTAFLVLVACIAGAFAVLNFKAANIIEIDTAEELLKIGYDDNYPVTGSYKLTADIDLSGKPWHNVGTDKAYFSGVFDGNGHTIKGMTLGTPDTPFYGGQGMGMFTNLSGTVKNLKLVDIYYNVGAAGTAKPVGAICGYARAGAIISNVYVSGTIIDTHSLQVRAGGLAGYGPSGATYKNCYIDIDMTVAYATGGGYNYLGAASIVGSADGGTITNCLSVGSITLNGKGYVGALYSDYDGRTAPVTVTNSYEAGTLSHSSGTFFPSKSSDYMITKEQLTNGYLSGKLSDAWTIDPGCAPHLTTFGSGDIEIDTAEELRKIGVDANYPLNGTYRLVADLDLSGSQWTPIGSTATPFTGIFNGAGHTISGMTMGAPGAPYFLDSGMGMFGELKGATVKNLKLKNIYFNVGGKEKNRPVGGICGYARNAETLIENVFVSGAIIDTASSQVRAGGIAGYTTYQVTIKNCYVDVDVTGAYDTTATGGKNAGVASIVGSPGSGTISNCVSVGDITLNGKGYIGALYSEYGGSAYNVDVVNSYEAGTLTYPNGTLLSATSGYTITKDQFTNGYLSDKLSSAWTVEAGKAPYLTMFGIDIPDPDYVEPGVIGISTADELRSIGVDPNYPLSGKYKLTADIDLSGSQWTPIAGYFSGVFDGNGHTISGMTMGTPETPYKTTAGAGMFEGVSGTVKNLKLKNIYFHASNAETYWPVGGICGYARYGSTLIENVYISGTIIDRASRQIRLGGIAGFCDGTATIKNCYVDVDITGEYGKTGTGQLAGIAGIVGSATKGTITGCVSIGDITLIGDGHIGALYSEYDGRETSAYSVNVTNSYSMSKLTYDRGTLMSTSNSHTITATQLISGNLALSDAWTVESGKVPCLTAFGKETVTLSGAVTAVENALADLTAGIGVTEEEILRAAVKAIASKDASVSVEDLIKVAPTNIAEGSVTANVLVKVGEQTDTATKVYTLAKIPALAYDFTTDVPGRANGTISILLPGNYVDEAYALYWGTESGISNKYSSLTTMEDIVVNGSTLTYKTEDQTYIPDGITHVWLTLDGDAVASLEIPAAHRMTLGTPKYTFGVFADGHFATYEGRADAGFKATMNLYKDAGAKFVISVGDLTNGGRVEEYAQFTSAYSGYTMPFWAALGNHDILSWNLASGLSPEQAMQNLKDAVPTFANPNHSAGSDYVVTVAEGKNAGYDYTMAYGDDLYVFLGVGVASNGNTSANNDMKLDPEQIDWLDSVFNKYYNVDKKDGEVFLLFHFYTLESNMVVASPQYKEWDEASSAMLDSVLRDYPGVIYFSGHNHFYFDADMNIYANEYIAVHVPSLTDPFPNYAGTEGSGTAYESYVVDVYDGYVLIKGVDAYTGQYAPHAMFMIADDSVCHHENRSEATCSSDSVCPDCDKNFGKNPENHGNNATYGSYNGNGTHDVCCSGCHAVLTENVTCTYVDYECTGCNHNKLPELIEAADLRVKDIVNDILADKETTSIVAVGPSGKLSDDYKVIKPTVAPANYEYKFVNVHFDEYGKVMLRHSFIITRV